MSNLWHKQVRHLGDYWVVRLVRDHEDVYVGSYSKETEAFEAARDAYDEANCVLKEQVPGLEYDDIDGTWRAFVESKGSWLEVGEYSTQAEAAMARAMALVNV